MIEQFAQKIVTQYDNLSPQKKALADIASIFVGVALGTMILVLAVTLNLVMEMAIFMVCYGIFGMLKLLYQSRVDYYELQEKLKK